MEHKCKKTKKVHRRGGSYKLETAEDVHTWGGAILDKECLQYLKRDDVVRVRLVKSNGFWWNRYVRIQGFLCNNYLYGVVDDPYNGQCHVSCNNCDEEQEYSKLRMYGCDGEEHNIHNFHLCEKCTKTLGLYCPRNCKLEVVSRPPFLDRTFILFKKIHIREVPDWTPNTIDLNERYEKTCRI
jgi:hypothetical protein